MRDNICSDDIDEQIFTYYVASKHAEKNVKYF